jgi:hypothetical protein
MIPFSKKDDGSFVANFESSEAVLISTLASQVGDLLGDLGTSDEVDPLPGLVIGGSPAIASDPAIARLLPNAYTDDEQSREFRELTERGLAGRKIANAQLVAATVGDDVSLNLPEAIAWMQSITDIRLVLAARLGIETDDSIVDETDENSALLDVYDWLAGVQDSLVSALDS